MSPEMAWFWIGLITGWMFTNLVWAVLIVRKRR